MRSTSHRISTSYWVPGEPLDPTGDPAAAADRLGVLAAAGATIVSARFVHHSLEHYLEQLAALVDARDQATT